MERDDYQSSVGGDVLKCFQLPLERQPSEYVHDRAPHDANMRSKVLNIAVIVKRSTRRKLHIESNKMHPLHLVIQCMTNETV